MQLNKDFQRKLLSSIQTGVINGINECEEMNEGKLKNFLLGEAMAGSVMGGMQSCSNLNPATNAPTEQTSGYKHDEYPDYSDRPWAFESYIGKTLQANYVVIENRYRIRKLCLNLPSNESEYKAAGYDFYANWQDCDWAIFYKKTEKRDNYYVDIFYSHGAPLFNTPYDGTYYDGAAFFELWYSDEEDKSMEERA